MKAALSPQLLAQPPDGVRGGRARPRFAREGKGFAGVFAGHTHFPLRSKSRSGPSVSLSPFTTDDGGEQHCFRGAAEDRSEESESFAAGERARKTAPAGERTDSTKPEGARRMQTIHDSGKGMDTLNANEPQKKSVVPTASFVFEDKLRILQDETPLARPSDDIRVTHGDPGIKLEPHRTDLVSAAWQESGMLHRMLPRPSENLVDRPPTDSSRGMRADGRASPCQIKTVEVALKWLEPSGDKGKLPCMPPAAQDLVKALHGRSLTLGEFATSDEGSAPQKGSLPLPVQRLVDPKLVAVATKLPHFEVAESQGSPQAQQCPSRAIGVVARQVYRVPNVA
ncbi:hypothetical protein DFH06DRAFT_1136984 [Mycena polygramma]|nr:hypothetical protein DFH06DRAFT_1136984 [Mycena polygramma]